MFSVMGFALVSGNWLLFRYVPFVSRIQKSCPLILIPAVINLLIITFNVLDLFYWLFSLHK